MDFEIEYKLQLFREEESEMFDKDGKVYSGIRISSRQIEMMRDLINYLDQEIKAIEHEKVG